MNFENFENSQKLWSYGDEIVKIEKLKLYLMMAIKNNQTLGEDK